MAKISDFATTAPYDAEYLDVNAIIGKPITIMDVTVFENAKGKGVHILIQLDGKEYRLCTHGVAIVDTLGREEIGKALDEGDYITCKIVKVASQRDKSRQVLRLEDA